MQGWKTGFSLFPPFFLFFLKNFVKKIFFKKDFLPFRISGKKLEKRENPVSHPCMVGNLGAESLIGL